MRNKKLFYFLISLFLLSGAFLNAQDNSTGLAPFSDQPAIGPIVVQTPTNVTTRGFSYQSTSLTASTLFKYFAGTPSAVTVVGSVQPYFFGNGDFGNPAGSWKFYVMEQVVGPYNIYQVDTATGTTTLIGGISGLTAGHSPIMFEWNHVTNKFYVYSSTSAVSSGQLYSMDWATRVCTPIGPANTTCPGLIAGGIGSGGNTLFGYDLVNDNAWKVNLTTGLATLLGTTGYLGNYGQDGGFDRSDWKLFWAACGGVVGLRQIDTTTGMSTQIGTFPYTQVIATGFSAVPGGGTPTMTDPTNMCAYTSAAVWSNFWGHASDNMGDTLYVVGGGTAGTGSTTVYRYNIGTNVMGTNGVPIPESKAGHSFTRCGNALYLIGGSTAVSTGGTTCYKYDPATGAWTSIAPIPAAISGHTAVNWGDSVIFVISGGWSTYNLTNYAYRPASNTWISTTALPSGMGRRSAACGLTNGKIYLSCGYNATFRNDLQIGTIGADASTITWAAGPVVPFLGGKTGSSRPGGTAVNGKFYMITGEVTPAPVLHDTIYVFDGATNTWSNIKGGRGGQTASNYWSAISYKVLSSGNIKIFIPGGSVTGGIGQLCCLQVPGCAITGITEPSVPQDYQLSQNYPNPFNPTTKISFSIPKAGLVTLKIYNIIGQEVSTLVNEVKSAGNYNVDFNGANLSSGVYFYAIKAGDFTSVKKMTLIK